MSRQNVSMSRQRYRQRGNQLEHIPEESGHEVQDPCMTLIRSERCSYLTCIAAFLMALLLYFIPLIVLHFCTTLRHQLVFLNFACDYDPNYGNPGAYGLHNTINFYLNGSAGKLGVWQILAGGSLTIHDGKAVILYMHGNAYSRSCRHRVETYKVLTGLNCHVVTFDYRGYGDSDGTPSEQGLIEDSLQVFEWVKSNFDYNPVYLWGHSLGSAVTIAVAEILTQRGANVMGLILEAPFNNLKNASFYHIFAIPYRILGAQFFHYVMRGEYDIFKSDERIRNVKYDMLFLHDRNDIIVPIDLGKELKNEAMKHRLLNQIIIFQETNGYSHTGMHFSTDYSSAV